MTYHPFIFHSLLLDVFTCSLNYFTLDFSKHKNRQPFIKRVIVYYCTLPGFLAKLNFTVFRSLTHSSFQNMLLNPGQITEEFIETYDEIQVTLRGPFRQPVVVVAAAVTSAAMTATTTTTELRYSQVQIIGAGELEVRVLLTNPHVYWKKTWVLTRGVDGDTLEIDRRGMDSGVLVFTVKKLYAPRTEGWQWKELSDNKGYIRLEQGPDQSCVQRMDIHDASATEDNLDEQWVQWHVHGKALETSNISRPSFVSKRLGLRQFVTYHNHNNNSSKDISTIMLTSDGSVTPSSTYLIRMDQNGVRLN